MSPTMHTSPLMRTVPRPGASWRHVSRLSRLGCAGRQATSRPERCAEPLPNVLAYLSADERREQRLLSSSTQRSLEFGSLRCEPRAPHRGRSSLYPLLIRSVAGPAPLVVGRIAWTVPLVLVRPVDGRLAKRSGEVAGAGDLEVVHESTGIAHAVRPVVVLFQRNFFQALAVGSSRPYVALNLVQRAGGLVDSSQAFVAADAGVFEDEQARFAVALDHHALLDVLDALADSLERERGVDAAPLERCAALGVVVGNGRLDGIVLIQLRDAGSMVLDQDLRLVELAFEVHRTVIVHTPPLPDERVREPEVDRADPVNDRGHLRAGNNVDVAIEVAVDGALARDPQALKVPRAADPGQCIQRSERTLALRRNVAVLIVEGRVIGVVGLKQMDRGAGFDPMLWRAWVAVAEEHGRLRDRTAAGRSSAEELPVGERKLLCLIDIRPVHLED